MSKNYAIICSLKLKDFDEPFIAVNRTLVFKEVCSYILLEIENIIKNDPYFFQDEIFYQISEFIQDEKYEEAISLWDPNYTIAPILIVNFPKEFN